jgi:aquaporin Z
MAFGLAIVVMIYAVGAVSGGHFNPAVTIGLAIARRFPWADVLAYIVTQVVAATVASVVLLGVASGQKGFSAKASGFAANGYGDHSPALYSLGAVILVEVVLTAVFLYVIIGVTDVRAPAEFAGIAIGLTLVIIVLASIPVSNTSVNPARSTGPAIIQHGWALGQLWVFWLAPIAGAAIAGATYHLIVGPRNRWPPSRPDRLRIVPPGGLNVPSPSLVATAVYVRTSPGAVPTGRPAARQASNPPIMSVA